MDPTAITTYLTTWYPELIAETGIDPAVIVGRVIETYDADTDLADAWANPLARYYLLDRAVQVFSVEFDVGLSGDSYRLNQRKVELVKERDRALAAVGWIVDLAESATTGTSMTTITGDYLTGGEAYGW